MATKKTSINKFQRGPESLLLSPSSPARVAADEFDEDDLDEDEDEDDLDEEEDEEASAEEPEPESEPKVKVRKRERPVSDEKLLLKLRMSSTRQLPVWEGAASVLSERGFEASAKIAAEAAAAISKFRRILDAEAKMRAADEARRELDGILKSL
jgi:hypothetical protein